MLVFGNCFKAHITQYGIQSFSAMGEIRSERNSGSRRRCICTASVIGKLHARRGGCCDAGRERLDRERRIVKSRFDIHHSLVGENHLAVAQPEERGGGRNTRWENITIITVGEANELDPAPQLLPKFNSTEIG